MSQFGMKPYFEWVLLANRYNKAVDFGSPISSWTPEMLKQDREKRNSSVEKESVKNSLAGVSTGELGRQTLDRPLSTSVPN
jgi:hypothetical protein